MSDHARRVVRRMIAENALHGKTRNGQKTSSSVRVQEKQSMSDQTRRMMKRLLFEQRIAEDATDEQYASVAKAVDTDVETLRGWVDRCDPTPNKKYAKWLLKMLKSDSIPSSQNLVIHNTLKTYHEIRKSSDALNPDVFSYKSWDELEQAVETAESEEDSKTRGELMRSYKEGVEEVFSIPGWRVLKITTPEAAVVYGMGSKWCTTQLVDEETVKEEYFEQRWEHNPFGNTDAGAAISPFPEFSEWIEMYPYMKIGKREGYPFMAVAYLNRGPLYIIQKEEDGKQELYAQYFPGRRKEIQRPDSSKITPKEFVAEVPEELVRFVGDWMDPESDKNKKSRLIELLSHAYRQTVERIRSSHYMGPRPEIIDLHKWEWDAYEVCRAYKEEFEKLDTDNDYTVEIIEDSDVDGPVKNVSNPYAPAEIKKGPLIEFRFADHVFYTQPWGGNINTVSQVIPFLLAPDE